MTPPPLPVRINVRCTQEFKDEVRDALEYNHEDASDVIRAALKQYVKRTRKRRAWDEHLSPGLRV